MTWPQYFIYVILLGALFAITVPLGAFGAYLLIGGLSMWIDSIPPAPYSGTLVSAAGIAFFAWIYGVLRGLGNLE